MVITFGPTVLFFLHGMQPLCTDSHEISSISSRLAEPQASLRRKGADGQRHGRSVYQVCRGPGKDEAPLVLGATGVFSDVGFCTSQGVHAQVRHCEACDRRLFFRCSLEEAHNSGLFDVLSPGFGAVLPGMRRPYPAAGRSALREKLD